MKYFVPDQILVEGRGINECIRPEERRAPFGMRRVLSATLRNSVIVWAEDCQAGLLVICFAEINDDVRYCSACVLVTLEVTGHVRCELI